MLGRGALKAGALSAHSHAGKGANLGEFVAYLQLCRPSPLAARTLATAPWAQRSRAAADTLADQARRHAASLAVHSV
jgi:hypothetical protein